VNGAVFGRTGARLERNGGDIVGYTRLTGEDQKTTLTMMTVFHKTADRNAREHRGRVVKTNADEVMLEFKDPTNAVRQSTKPALRKPGCFF
jgi:class 3 adenylate cyclase